ncbi:MAG: efflux RND transporter periplasmic adaptor subunit [Chitinophagaceae bacterium]|nr:efflux RND transporter periplasmic adaptor subunit [Chitinophagaceae bacterium]
MVAASKEPLSLDFSANGKFAAGQELRFAAEMAGRVISVLVDEGDYVKKGQTLAVVKTDNLAVDIRNAEDAYQNALRDKQRYENAFQTGGVTRQQVDQAILALRNAEAKMELAKIKASDANIRASINGIINKRMIEPGSVLAPGTQLFEIVDVSMLTLDIAVDESQVARLQVGADAVIKASVIPDKQFEGKIEFIAPKADENLNFPVKIRVKNNAGSSLKAGMYGIASFRFQQQEPAMLIPRSAFIGSVSSNQVFVADESNTARLKTVVTGRLLGDKVEVVRGLQEGERLIVSGQVNLTDGTLVNVLQ